MTDPRFTSQGSTAEDRLKEQSVGLLNLSDYRKRHADALEQAEDGVTSTTPSGAASRDATPTEGGSTPQTQVKKKRKAAKGKLSFAVDDEDDGDAVEANLRVERPGRTKRADSTRIHGQAEESGEASKDAEAATPAIVKRRLGPNTSIANAPRVLTKSAMLKEVQAREELRKQFIAMQEAVKAAEISIPFVFYDGTNVPGGSCRVKKGDYIWVFLDKCRKLGAELAVGASGEARNRREWARVGVDDLMLVRGEIIVPHHYEFYYFVVNKTVGYNGRPLFGYSAEPPKEGMRVERVDGGLEEDYDPLSIPGQGRERGEEVETGSIEGSDDDPNVTKVVSRQWYEKNKHIFPASTWEEFSPNKDYAKSLRKDAQGNTFFFPR